MVVRVPLAVVDDVAAQFLHHLLELPLMSQWAWDFVWRQK